MPKTFYTDRDIEDLAKRGVISLVEDDDVVLTDLARDKAMRLGIELVREHERPPSAPERPYITKLTSPSASEEDQAKGSPSPIETERPYITKLTSPSAETRGDEETGVATDLHESVRAEVVARLGDAVDPQLLDTIIRRVLGNVGVK
jgi:hypothetical protein